MIVPGSQTTLAQLGIPESYTPASHRFPTRMFPGETPGFFEAVKVRERKPKQAPAGLERRDAAMNGVPGGEGEAEILYEEDLTSDEGAIYPIVKGAIVDWPCFMAFLTYIYNTLSPPFHTPILIVAQPAWRQDDLVKLCQFVFQTFKTPAFNVIDSAAAVNWAWGRDESTVIDVGYEKCDITAVTGFAVDQTTRSIALDYGGEFMTQKLLELLRPKGFDRNMCEQLKRSPICEILPLYTPLPTEHAHPGATTDSANPAAAASTGATSTEAGAAANLPAQNNLPRGPGLDTEAGLDDLDIKDAEDNDGVLDIASIVASGKTNEFLAKQERQKAEKAAKKAAADLASAPRPVRLPNSQRAKATFHYEQRKPVEESATNGEKAAGPDVAPAGEHGGEVAPASRKEERRRQKENATFVRKEIEVGVERFQAGNYMIEQIAAAVHRVILKSDISRRAILWDSLIICGNGSKVKGKQALWSHNLVYSIGITRLLTPHPR
jgi:actin-related protein 9